jgi:hypothetical protein
VVAAALGAAALAVIAVLVLRGPDVPQVRQAANPFLPSRGPLVHDHGLLQAAARAWAEGQDHAGVPGIEAGRRVEALWAGRAAGGDEVVALGQVDRAVLARRRGGQWSVVAGARRVSGVAPVSFDGAAVLLPGASGTRIVSTRTTDEIATGGDRLRDGMVLPAEGNDVVSRGLVPPDRPYGVMTAFGLSSGDAAVSYKVNGPRDHTRIARLIRAGHVVGLYEALYPGDEGAGAGTGIGQLRVLADADIGSLGHGVVVAHSRNGPASTSISVGFDDPTRHRAELLGTAEPPLETSDQRPLFGASMLSSGSDRAPLLIAGDARIRRYDVYRGARRNALRGPIAVVPAGGAQITAVIGHTASGAAVLPVAG